MYVRRLLGLTIVVVVASVGLPNMVDHASASSPLVRTFGTEGFAFPGPGASLFRGLAQDRRGKVIAVGERDETYALVSRYGPNGSIDDSFAGPGGFEKSYGDLSAGRAVAVEPDGDVVVAGSAGETNMIVLRFHPDGSLDRSFGEDGIARTKFSGYAVVTRDLQLLPDGRIAVVGYSLAIDNRYHGFAVLLRPDGSPYKPFGGDGVAEVRTGDRSRLTVELSGVALLPGRKLFLVGDIGGRLFTLREDLRAQTEPSFGNKGFRLYDVDADPLCICAQATGLAVDRHGRLLVSARTDATKSAAVVMRLHPDGTRDHSFGDEGVVRVTHGSRLAAESIAVQKNGKIAVAGFYNVAGGGEARFAVMRLLPDGRRDPGFGHRGIFTRDFGYEGIGYAALALRDGGLMVAGRLNREKSTTPGVYETAEPFLARFRP